MQLEICLKQMKTKEASLKKRNRGYKEEPVVNFRTQKKKKQ